MNKNKRISEIMNFVTGQLQPKQAVVHYQLINDKIDILEVFELKESTESINHETLTYVCHLPSGECGFEFVNEEVKAAYVSWRKSNLDKINYCANVLELIRASHLDYEASLRLLILQPNFKITDVYK